MRPVPQQGQEHRGGLPVGREAKVAVGHVLQGAVLVEQNIRGEGVGVLDRRRLDFGKMQIVGRERGRFPVCYILRKRINLLAEQVLAPWLRTGEDQKVLRPRESYVVFAPEVEILRPFQRLERQTRKVLQFKDSIKVRPVLAWRLRKRADDRDGELQPLRLVNRHH